MVFQDCCKDHYNTCNHFYDNWSLTTSTLITTTTTTTSTTTLTTTTTIATTANTAAATACVKMADKVFIGCARKCQHEKDCILQCFDDREEYVSKCHCAPDCLRKSITHYHISHERAE